MKRPAWPALVVTALLLATAPAVSAQTAPSPSRRVKPLGAAEPGQVLWQIEWTSWTADQVATWLVQRPLKTLALEGLDTEAMLELKGLAAGAETGVHEIVDSFSRGEVEAPDATSALEALAAEYGRLLGELIAR